MMTGKSALMRKQILKLSASLCQCTHFTRTECTCLLIMHRELTKLDANGKMKLPLFRDFLIKVFDITDDFILDNLFRIFDFDGDGEVTMNEWVLSMSIWLRGTLEEKKRFCFSLYDLDGDGNLAREELFQLLKSTLVLHEDDVDEGVKDLVEVTLKKMDQDGDGILTFPDFSKTVDDEPLLLEAFGDCLPSQKAKSSFEAQFRFNGFTFVSNYMRRS